MSSRLGALLRPILSNSLPLSPGERLRSTFAAVAGLLLASAIIAVLPVPSEYRHLLAPIGATSVILFCLPHSPLAQPWSVVGGLLLSAGAGLLCGYWIPWPALAIATAVGLAVFLMAWLRCLHPPGGAMALLAVLAVKQTPAASVLAIVACNIVAILIAVVAINNLIPGRRYPMNAPPTPAQRRTSPALRSIGHEDLQHALDEIDAYLDISEDDLVDVYNRATDHAFRRHVGLRCADIMTPDPLTAEFATDLNVAWGKLRAHAIQSLPVVDRSRRVIGLISVDDFVSHVAPDPGKRLGENLRRLLRPTPGSHSEKPEVVGQIMRLADDIVIAAAGDDLAATAASLGRRHQHTVPVVDTERRLVGILTQGDVIGGLFRQLALSGARVPA